MGKFLQIFLAATLIQLSFIQPLTAEPQTASRSRYILEIHSYHSGLSWTDSVIKGLRDTFDKSGAAVQVNAEFLDVRRYADAESSSRIRELISYKLRSTAPDVVIISDNGALEFALQRREQLFPKTPLVFCGINSFDPAMISKYRGITGVAEDLSIADTVNTALRFNPGTKEVIVIGRISVAADKANRDSFLAALPTLPSHLKITFWDDLPMSALQDRLMKLGEGKVIFINGLIANDEGRQLMYGETTQWISRFSPVPAYSLWDVYLGYGIVGGKLVSGYRQGKIAAEMALQILNGQDPDRLPVASASEANQFMFDYRQLERFKIPLSLLPKDAIVINQPDSFYSKYKNLVLVTAVIFLVLSGLILMLSLAIFRRRRAEEALRESERLYTSLVDTIPDVIIRTDLNGKIVFINDHALEIGGYSREEVEGQDMLMFIAPEDRERLVHNLSIMRGGRLGPQEYQVTMKDGRKIPFEVNGDVSRSKDGTPFGTVHLCRDITERKRAEKKLRDNEKRLRNITTNLPGAVFQFYAKDSGEYGISYVSGRMAEIFRLPNDIETLFPAFLAHVHTEDRNEFLTSIGKAVETMSPWDFEGRFVKPAGEMIWFHGLSIPTRHEDRLVFDGILLDVTERKQAEERSRQAEEKFTKVFMTTPDCIAVTRLADGQIIDTNLGFEEITGWKRSEAIGRTSIDIDFWVDPSARELMVADLQAGRDVLYREFQFRRKDGAGRTGIYSARSIRIVGEACLIFILQDITERRRMEEERRKLEQQLSQSQKMEAIGTLAGGIAHDFNNILSGIMGYSELCRNAAHDGAKVHSYMEQVLKAAERAKDLVQQILTFSRKAEQEKKPLSLAPIVQEVVKFIRASLPTTIEIRQQINETTDAIMADYTQMHQVLMNLCTNAGHAMKETGGVLEIGLKEVVMDAANPLYNPPLKNGRYLELSVRDTGRGISQENLGRIFDPYFTTKATGEGTGLGLAVVHGIVKDHDGEIRIYSEEGRGTIFRIYLPLIDNKGEERKDIENPGLKGKGETILFVDDEKMVVDISKELLEGLGYRVITETDPLKAIETFKEGKQAFDIVITDKTMPHLTGFDVAKEIRAVSRDIPIVLCSGFQEKGDPEKITAFGISRMIIKPIRMSALADTIREVLDKRLEI